MKVRFEWLLVVGLCWVTGVAAAQPDRWQQRVDYVMDITMDAAKHQFVGTQKLTYTNNSPDTIYNVYYHLYFNAFQQGSSMDVRSRTIDDPDPRVSDRIGKLKEEERGYHLVDNLMQDGKVVSHKTVGTILEVKLAHPIPPKSSSVLDMSFHSQVPLQIRRSGWNSAEGVELSMTQWYPKLCEYDYQGWHADPYVGREFYGVWGDYDVTIRIAKNYVVAAGGYLQNPQEVGFGYETKGSKVTPPSGDMLVWHFKAPNVHDFAWAADPDYVHEQIQVPNGPTVHFFWQEKDNVNDSWHKTQPYIAKLFEFNEYTFGRYQYDSYSVIQGGDGGMEYPMATLITGKRPFNSLLGVMVHEIYHSWYQMMLATNESLFAWMDEGFTTYASQIGMQYLLDTKENPLKGTYNGYFQLAASGVEEPMSTHADHFNTNFGYGAAAYNKGAVYLHQLSYVVGKSAFQKGMLNYFNTWKFKHPNDNDFIRIMERASGLELDWYNEYMVNSLKQIDYAVKSVEKESRKKTIITLERVGKFPMPIDVYVTYDDDTYDIYSIPLELMRGSKPKEDAKAANYFAAEPWEWVMPSYQITIPEKIKNIKSVTIDPTERLADVNTENNTYLLEAKENSDKKD